jgi:predicted RNA-binding Zn ribbon-like protein
MNYAGVMTKRQDAPGGLELVRAFVNTLDIEEGAEALDSPPALTGWLVEHTLLPPGDGAARPAELRRARELRESLRALLLEHAGHDEGDAAKAVATLDHAARRAKLRAGFGPGGEPILVAEANGIDGALGRLLAVVHAAQADGSWLRLKACPEETCRWAFYDHTKNRSGRWCTMQECGNRAKVRTYRERHQH